MCVYVLVNTTRAVRRGRHFCLRIACQTRPEMKLRLLRVQTCCRVWQTMQRVELLMEFTHVN